MLNEIFRSIGLGDQHSACYALLAERGEMSAGEIAKAHGLPRSSTYDLLSDLAKQGLVVQTQRSGIKRWIASDPKYIDEAIVNSIDSLEKKRVSFQQLLPSLTQNQHDDIVSPHLEYFEGVDGVKAVLRDMLLYKNIETEALWPIKDMIELLGEDFFIHLNTRRIQQKLSTRAIWPEEKAVDIKKYPFLGVGEGFFREIRIAPKGVVYSMGYWAYGNSVAFLSSRQEAFGFIVRSAELRQLMKTQFEVLWKLSQAVKSDPSDTEAFQESVPRAQ